MRTSRPTDTTASRFTSSAKDLSISTWRVSFDRAPVPFAVCANGTYVQFPSHPVKVSFLETTTIVQGGMYFASTGRIGSNGAMRSAPRATIRNAMRINRPIQLIRPARLRRSSKSGWTMRPMIEWRGIQSSRRILRSFLMGLQPDAGIHHGAEDVDGQADREEDRGVDDHGPLDQRHVLRDHGFEKEEADPFDRERLLGEDGPCEEDGELQPEDRDHRDERVLERVPTDDPPFRDPARPARFRVVCPHRPDHVRAHGLHEEPAEHESEGQAGEEEMADRCDEVVDVSLEQGVDGVHPRDRPRIRRSLPPAMGREPTEINREDDLKDDP